MHVAAAFRAACRWPVFPAELSKTSSYVVGAVRERCWSKRASSKQVRSMAVSDPLTGLANYRRLISVIEASWTRSAAHEPPVSIVLLDMDG